VRRKFVVWACIPLFAGGVGYAVQVYNSPPIGPVLEYPTRVDLGDREMGEVAVGTITIANRGGKDLRIDRIEVSCTCAGLERELDGRYVPFDELVVEPGTATQLAVRMMIRAMPGTPAVSQIHFRTNDPVQPAGTIDVVASRVNGVAFSPTSAVFGDVLVGDEAERIVEVRSIGTTSLTLDRVVSSDPSSVEVELLPPMSPDAGSAPDVAFLGRVRVKLRGSRPGPVDRQVLVHTSQEGVRSTWSIPVTGRVAALVTAYPDRIVLPMTTPDGSVYRARCLVTSYGGRAFQLNVGSIPDGVSVRLPDPGGGPVRFADITVDPAIVDHGTGQPLAVFLSAQVGDTTIPIRIAVECRPVTGGLP
jgi:hypothetical protein